MIEQFVLEYAKLIASEPEKINVTVTHISEGYKELVIVAGENDAGKLIGKEGKMIGAIKTLISGCKAKDGNSYKVIVKSL